jgi:hypothetical protein
MIDPWDQMQNYLGVSDQQVVKGEYVLESMNMASTRILLQDASVYCCHLQYSNRLSDKTSGYQKTIRWMGGGHMNPDVPAGVRLRPNSAQSERCLDIHNDFRCNNYTHFDAAICYNSCKASQYDGLSQP